MRASAETAGGKARYGGYVHSTHAISLDGSGVRTHALRVKTTSRPDIRKLVNLETYRLMSDLISKK